MKSENRTTNTGNSLDRNRANYFEALEKDLYNTKVWAKTLFFTLVLMLMLVIYLLREYTVSRNQIKEVSRELIAKDSLVKHLQSIIFGNK